MRVNRIINKIFRMPIVMVRSLRIAYLRTRGVRIGRNVWISPKAKIDTTGGNITISDNCVITHGSIILSHDMSRRMISPGKALYGRVHLGKNVFIGVNAVVLPDVTIGDNAIIGAGAVVTTHIPENAIAVGNPARVLREYRNTSTPQEPSSAKVQ